ncbi:MAG: M1 family aminopeptidase [bacterium]|nr:M1 family aminopeptidase [bacterium]
MNSRKLLPGLILMLGVVCALQAAPQPMDDPSGYKILFDMHEGRNPARLDNTDDVTGYNVLHYDLAIRFNPTDHSVAGHVDMRFKSDIPSLTDLAMDLKSNMVVDSIRVNGAAATYTLTSPDNLNIHLPVALPQGDSALVKIYYHGFPITGSMGALSWDQHLGVNIISSLSESEGARTWWPCKDMPSDKATATMAWTVPSTLYATSNGNLQSITTPEPGWKTYSWVESYPITTYLIAVTATNFAHFRNWYVSTSGDSMPLDNYVYPEDSLHATIDFADLATVIGYFASVFGPYPYPSEKYGHAEFPWGGAMEHQTLTSYGEDLITGTNAYHWIMVHELSHQWWGDMVTCETWMDIWLNEGFATYCDALWIESTQGQTAFQSRMASFRQTYFQGDQYGEGRFPIYNPVQMWGGTVYQKGGWILHMIRYVVGEDVFWNSFWPAWRNNFSFDAVTTAELQQTLETVSGQDLEWFFHEWVYMAGYPVYQWGWTTENIGGGATRVKLSIRQTQQLINQTPIFTMPIQINIVKNTGTETVIAQDSLAYQTFSFVVNGTVSDVLFDPTIWILKTSTETAYSAPVQTVAMTPINPPIQIPGSGGSFQYNINVHNTATSPVNMDIWTLMKKLPNGPWTGPYMNANRTIAAGGNPTRLRSQNIAAGLEAGTYLYEARLGDYPNAIWDVTNFTFIKNTAGDASGGFLVDNFDNTGEDFDDASLGSTAANLPGEFKLIGSTPNPFNPTTTISFQLPAASRMSLVVYDVSGRLVSTLVDGFRDAGSHQVTFDGSKLASGVYLYRLEAGGYSANGKMVLLK